MLTYIATNQFKKDFKKAMRQGKDIEKLNTLVRLILAEETLPASYRDHILIGNFKGRRECHIAPNWLLMYYIKDGCAIFERTGSHSELFK